MPEHFGLNRVIGDRPQQMDYQQHSSPTVLSNIHQHTGHALVHALGQQALQMQNETNDSNNRWSQYHHLWRQHMFINGKSTKELGPEENKKDDGELWCNIEAQAAFLGPNLWDKTLPYDTDFKEHSLQYVDLDEFLSENGITGEGIPAGGGSRGPPTTQEVLGHEPPMQLTLTKRERSPSPSPCEPLSPATLNPCSPADSTMSMASSGREFDPRTRTFSDEELKPQPMVKKSRKQHDIWILRNKSYPAIKKNETFVPDDLKDEKYWARRRKNNMAAKRSRDARRMKENQIALRAGFLEKENMGLRQELDRLKKENLLLRDKLSKYGGEV